MLIINKIAEVPKVKNEVGTSKATHTLSLRGESEASDVAIHRVSGDVVDLSLRLLVHSGSPRAFSPRDEKTLEGGSFISLTTHSLSLRGVTTVRCGNPSSLGERGRLVFSLTGSEWIAAHSALGMTEGKRGVFSKK